jgi:Outer membrane protein beta-barrel domain
MVKVVLTVAALLLCENWSLAHAQKRVEVGLLLDYLGVLQTQTNNFGVGGRLGYRVQHNVMVEGELAYDYGVNFQELYSNIANGNVTAIEQTSIGVTQGLIGPKLQPAHGDLRPFVTLKGGFIDFRLGPSLIPNSGVVSTVLGIRTSNLNAALYPAGGAEATLGPLGLRLELGDLIYFNDGEHNNLRIVFGPILRF